jgi:hypothetical protein
VLALAQPLVGTTGGFSNSGGAPDAHLLLHGLLPLEKEAPVDIAIPGCRRQALGSGLIRAAAGIPELPTHDAPRVIIGDGRGGAGVSGPGGARRLMEYAECALLGFIRTMSGEAPVHAPLRGAEPLMVWLSFQDSLAHLTQPVE